MSTPEPNTTINLIVKKFPENLLIPGVDNVIALQVSNNSENKQEAQFVFEGENLNISFSDDYKGKVGFEAGETKDIILKLEPISDGFGKLILNVYGLKPVTKMVKVQKVKEHVKKEKAKKIFSKFILSEELSSLKPDDVKDINLKIDIIWNKAKKLYESNNKTELLQLLSYITSLIINSKIITIADKKYKNKIYKHFKNGILIIGEINSPGDADSIINTIENQDLKEKVSSDLFDDLYEMVEEAKIELTHSIVYSQYFMFNTCISKINESVKNFASLGGNLSNNLLINEIDFKVLFISLFSYNFSIFPIIDRVYSDLKINLNKSIAYFIYPSIDNLDEMEVQVVNNTLKQFLISDIAQIPDGLIIFNLDYIPYLGTPTIIIASEPDTNKIIEQKMGTLEGNVDLIIDDSLFEGGRTLENLRQVFPPNKCKIVNLLLSYEFINDYEVFKKFVLSLT